MTSPSAGPSRPFQVMSAGIAALVLTLGLARFAYTPLLPVMQAQAGLSDSAGGWLATINYVGYMLGTFIATRVKDAQLRFQLYRAGLGVAVVSLLGMGLTTHVPVWAVLRFFAGLSSVAGMLLGSGMVLAWLVEHGRRPELGLNYAGLGLGLAVSGVAALLMAGRLDWASQWRTLGVLGLVLLVPAWRWMPRPSGKAPPTRAGTAAADSTRDAEAKRRAWLLQGAYFCAGVGFVISATFLVAIIARQPAMSGGGNLAWLIVGLAATPAVLGWDRVARRVGDARALMLAYAVQIASFLMPLLGDSLMFALLGALLFGATFTGIVGLTMALVGRQEPANPSRAMARLTLSYGVGQILAPAAAGMLAQRTGSYAGALVMAAVVMAVGVVLLGMLPRETR
jgi:predicted MFS family arabinose efflux permease